MEPANLHQHHLQGRQVVGSSSLSIPSSHGAGSARAWTQNSILNTGDFNLDYNNGVILNSRQRNETLIPHPNNSMVQDMGFHWNGNAGATFTDHSAHDLQLPKIIKGKLSETFPTFSEMLISSPPTVKNKQMDLNDDLREKLLVKTVSSALPINGNPSSEEIYSSSLASTVPGRLNFCQIYPSINISNLNQPPSSISWGSFDMNLEALDLLNSTRFNGRFGQSASDNFAMCKENFSFDVDDGQQPSLRSPYSPSKVSSFNSEITGTKRPNSFMEPKATTQAAPKKSRLESRATCPPFKVRKEKLGDRIAALQQLVAPFGKTDTASVLMEAIGYIKFLQNQVETLSVPYMKSSHNKSSRTMPTVSTRGDENEEPKRDLLSRGLCLVPLSCMSYMTSDGGCDGGIWPPPC